jgi:predicted AlkP superfamily pyrophosphatase or phosphodiesterase
LIIIVTAAKKVLFIIVDGIPADVLENATIPNMKKIGKYKRAYTGGDIGSYTETVTISAPGYMNLITGTWGNKHNVYDNSVKNPNYNYKNIFRLLKEQQSDKKIGIFSTWTDNRVKLIGEGLSKAGNITFDYKFDGYELDLITYPHDPSDLYIQHIDQRVVNETSICIKNDAPDLSWVYLQYTDDIGHEYGDSKEFYEAINDLDQQIGRIYESIEYRIKYHQEDWLFVITTDHGRDQITGKEHGEQSERERTTWIVTNNQETNTYFQDYIPAIVDILPTMARFMNIEIPLRSARELDGVPFIGKVSLAKPTLSLSGDNLTITWKTLDNTGNVKVWLSTTNLFKDGLTDDYKLIGTGPVENEMAVFNLRDYPSKFYKIVLEGQYNMVNRWVFRPQNKMKYNL